jgi:uncharacterized repeat protein (TIGR03843 family)
LAIPTAQADEPTCSQRLALDLDHDPVSDSRSSIPETLARDQALAILSQGDMNLVGEFIWGSNYTFLVDLIQDEHRAQAIYKPSRGERPLWDFDSGTLAAREVAAYLASQELGWGMVPPTILRQDGLAGPGSLQLFIDVDPDRNYMNFSEDEKKRLMPVALFDVLINNADRKAGHVLLDALDRLWLIDHGVCFHEEYKLRTVIWDFVDEAIPQPLLTDLLDFRTRLADDMSLRAAFAELLTDAEITALLARADALLSEPRFPAPGPGRPYPWPLI